MEYACNSYGNCSFFKGISMLQGISIATQGMTALMDKQDQIANNLANINTTGFKQSGLFTKTFQKILSNDSNQPFVNTEIKPDNVYVDYSEGAMVKTGAPLDLFVKGSGFLTVMTSEGIRYTRNGNLSLNKEGLLVTSDGSKVMGKDGVIKIDKDAGAISINENGEVVQDGETIETLRISDFNKPYSLVREGNGYFNTQDSDEKVIQSDGFAIEQGFLEESNVSVIGNMVNMISAYRNYEADQKAVQSQDQTLDKAVNQIGRLS
jgi:flagellar basal-body rod protein FlgF